VSTRVFVLASILAALAAPFHATAESILLQGDPGDGLPVVHTEDGAFSLHILGYVQPRLVFFDGGADTDLNPLVAGDPNDRPGFKIRRARFGIGGTLGKVFRYEFEAGASARFDTLDWSARPDSEELGIHAAWLEWHATPYFQVRAGADKVPFGGQQTQGSVGLTMIERAVVAEEITPGHDAGVRLRGTIAGPQRVFAPDGITWTLGVYSGDHEVLTPDDNTGVLGVGRLSVAFGDDMGWSESCLWDGKFGVRIGGGGAINWERESRDHFVGADLLVKFWRFSVRGEYLYAKREPTYQGTDEAPYPERFRRHGYLTQLGFVVVPDLLEIAFRHDYYDDDLQNDDDYSAVRYVTGGANLFFLEGRVKVQVNYIHRAEPGAVEAISNDTVMAQATLAL